MTTHAEDQDEAEVWPEDVPDGTFGHAQHRLPARIAPCTPAEQDRHRADLLAALSGWRWQDESRISAARRGCVHHPIAA